ncbi:MAG: hypothetical protein HYR94_22820 [Chloroflexi bacterium]|nr:hypothetical protein [Chloroflexota bacterium]
MIAEQDQLIIEQKQKLLTQHRRNLSYLEQQAACYGLNVPLEIHNAHMAEQDKVTTLERDLGALGISPQPKASWRALVIDADANWRKIIAEKITQLGGAAVEGQTVPPEEQFDTVANCAVAIVGVTSQTQNDPSIREWIKTVVKLSYNLPLILLASWEDRDTPIALRQALRENNINVTPMTIFKENFDTHWFSRVVHQLLIT